MVTPNHRLDCKKVPVPANGFTAVQTALMDATNMTIEERSKQANKEKMDSNSMPISVGVFWILPMLFIATLTRFAVDTGPSFLPQQSRPISLTFDEGTPTLPRKNKLQRDVADDTKTSASSSVKAKTSSPKEPSSFLSNKPFSYQEVSTHFLQILGSY